MSGETSRLTPLIDLAREDSDETRRQLLREIVDIFLSAPQRFSAAERRHFDAILCKTAAGVDAGLRREIAEKLADAEAAPEGLVRQFAHDVIAVAEPVLKRSRVIGDDDLIDVVRRRGQPHMKAVCRRRSVPAAVAAVLAELGETDVLIALARNKGAAFDVAAMELLVEHSRSLGDLQAPMAGRHDLPPHLLTRLYFFVSSPLKRDILKRTDLVDPALVNDAVAANRERVLNAAVSGADDDFDDARRYIRERIDAGVLNESLLRELIEHRRMTEFLLGFAYFVGVDAATGQAMLEDRSWESLAIGCRGAALDRETFAKIAFNLQRNTAEQQRALKLIDLYQKIPAEAAERMMRFWRLRASGAPADGVAHFASNENAAAAAAERRAAAG